MLDKRKKVRLLDLGVVEPAGTQSVYHAVAELMHEDSPDTIIFCRPRTPYVCLGYHQVYEATFDCAALERRKLPVFRRRLGGGATYLDSNQLFYQCVFHHTRVPVMLKDVYQLMLAAPVAALQRLGLNARLYDLNEIEVDGKRIAGIGGGRIGEAAVVVGNVLLDFDFVGMADVWRVPSESFRELGLKAMRERITTLRQCGHFDVEAVQRILLEEFAKAFALEEGLRSRRGELTSEEHTRSTEIAKRMVSPEYLSLHSDNGSTAMMHALKISARAWIHAAEAQINEHLVRANFRVCDEFIEEARLESTPVNDWTAVERALQGAPLKDWEERMRSFCYNAQELCSVN